MTEQNNQPLRTRIRKLESEMASLKGSRETLKWIFVRFIPAIVSVLSIIGSAIWFAWKTFFQ